MSIIDLHTHIYPDRIAPAVLSKFTSCGNITLSSDGTGRGLMESNRKRGIDLSINLPVATNPEKVVSMNDALLSYDGSEGILSLASMHPDCPCWYEELARIKALGYTGIKIHPLYQRTDLNDIRYKRILYRASELSLPVVCHCGYDIGYPDEERAIPSQIAEVMKDVNPTNLICAHMGALNYWDQVLELLPQTGVSIDTAFSLGKNTCMDLMDMDTFLRMVQAFTADRIYFGSDSPWDDPLRVKNFIESAPITREEKDKILGRNAEMLFLRKKK